MLDSSIGRGIEEAMKERRVVFAGFEVNEGVCGGGEGGIRVRTQNIGLVTTMEMPMTPKGDWVCGRNCCT